MKTAEVQPRIDTPTLATQGTLINTPLQRGADGQYRDLNRFSGFLLHPVGYRETAKAVKARCSHVSTLLKRCVNED